MIPIIEIFLGLSIGIAILWVTVSALVKFTRRIMSGEERQDVLKNFWRKPFDGVLPAKESQDPRGNGRRGRTDSTVSAELLLRLATVR
jgi:hypothetical protein